MRRGAFPFAAAAVALTLFYGCGERLEINPESSDAAHDDGSSEDSATAGERAEVDAAPADGGKDADAAPDAPVDGPDEGSDMLQLGTPKVVFVLMTPVLPATTPLDENGIGHQGRDGFDGRCRAEASAAGLAAPGTFVAWMSVSTGNGANAIDRLSNGVSWYLASAAAPGPSSDLVFASKASIVAMGPKIGITRAANGTLVVPASGEDRLWTGTDAMGHYLSALSCGDWQQSGANGRAGQFNAVGQTFWTHSYTRPCTEAYRAICFQQ